MTPAEWKNKTIADLYERQKKREAEKLKGEKSADSFLAERRLKSKKKKDRIRAKCYK